MLHLTSRLFCLLTTLKISTTEFVANDTISYYYTKEDSILQCKSGFN